MYKKQIIKQNYTFLKYTKLEKNHPKADFGIENLYMFMNHTKKGIIFSTTNNPEDKDAFFLDYTKIDFPMLLIDTTEEMKSKNKSDLKHAISTMNILITSEAVFRYNTKSKPIPTQDPLQENEDEF